MGPHRRTASAALLPLHLAIFGVLASAASAAAAQRPKRSTLSSLIPHMRTPTPPPLPSYNAVHLGCVDDPQFSKAELLVTPADNFELKHAVEDCCAAGHKYFTLGRYSLTDQRPDAVNCHTAEPRRVSPEECNKMCPAGFLCGGDSPSHRSLYECQRR